MNIVIDEQKFKVIAGKLYEQIISDNYIKQKPTVIGILNGGKIIADYIANRLNLNIDYIKVSSRGTPGQKGKSSINKFIDITITDNLLVDRPYLILDDIADSGLTIQIVKRLLPRSKSAVLLTKNAMKTDYYGMVIEDKWVDFYWEE